MFELWNIKVWQIVLSHFVWIFYVWAVQKYVNLVDLVKSFPTSIYLQKSASIQPRTSLSKFGGKFNSLFICLLTGDQRCTFLCEQRTWGLQAAWTKLNLNHANISQHFIETIESGVHLLAPGWVAVAVRFAWSNDCLPGSSIDVCEPISDGSPGSGDFLDAGVLGYDVLGGAFPAWLLQVDAARGTRSRWTQPDFFAVEELSVALGEEEIRSRRAHDVYEGGLGGCRSPKGNRRGIPVVDTMEVAHDQQVPWPRSSNSFFWEFE